MKNYACLLTLALCAGLGPTEARAQAKAPHPAQRVPAAPAKAAPAKAALTKTAPAKAAPDGPAVRYNVAFPNAVHHEARITATFAGLPAGPLRVRMARSSPGRYAEHDFIKNVYYVVATDGDGHPLPLARPDAYGWNVTPGPDGKVLFSYTLYADRSDGTYAGIDQQHAHLNVPATFCYALGLESRAVEAHFDAPPAWKAATQLRPGGEKNTFTAPNLAYFMDSPVVLGAQQVRTWEEGDQTIELAALYLGTLPDLDLYAKKVQRVVKEEKAIFGTLPVFDFGRYTFLADYLDQTTGDGMEHRNSTSLTAPRGIHGEDALLNLRTVAHEFFHAWNVKRLRPKDLEPFDLQRTNMSDALWLAEGFTQYYGELALRRAKFYDDEQFLDKVGGWVNARLASPGARYASAVDMSRQAVFTDAGVSIDPTNTANTYLTYYYQGAGLALVLDLELRQQYRTSLDQYMRALWQQYGQKQANYAPARPYTLPDLQRVLGETAHDTAFAGRFFRQYVYGHEAPRFSESLGAAGLALVPTRVLTSLAQQVEFDAEGRGFIATNTLIGSGLYKAGIDRGDQLVMLDDKALKSPADLAEVLRRHVPNDLVMAQVRSRGGIDRTLQLVLTEAPNVRIQPLEEGPAKAVAPAQQALRDAWLATQVAN
ncbi:M61 family metallopeptidase [Hymenobacter caeli]|uniref:Metalloprotease with PDZ domain n=1 Tax=Hymenobacter caeli TaxID=2735894 RepID=A0ABX2FLQ0_9BACT|nr:M61 family metallopeptidase [Hymenobacter caeli]NRT17454.1 putative metalloprotease with PDZ domain [Hymenobacter caeli]